MTKEAFTIHACEQVLRFTRVKNWKDLSEERKVQLGFNMGVMALSLDISKEDGFKTLAAAREENITMTEFHEHIRNIVIHKKVHINDQNIEKSF